MSPGATADDRTELVTMLKQASELEHALCCQYLYAAFSLKDGSEPGLTPSQVALVGHWNQQITKIAAQEMYHLMLACNLLTAIGEEPNLNRENFPQPAKHYSDIALPSMLAPFGADTVYRFLCWEKPEAPGWWDAKCQACAQTTNDRLGLPMLTDAEAPYSTIGQLYGLIDSALKANPGWIEPSQAERQVTTDLVPFSPPVAAITTYDDAHVHIEEIVREGEGTGDHDTQAHFAFFHQISDELGSAPAFVPGWPTVDDPAYDPALAPPGATLITDPTAAAVGLLFNDAYLLLLQTLSRLFLVSDETDEQRRTLANAAMAFMPLVVKPLGKLLTRTPAGPEHPDLYAGPSFELPQPIPLPLGDAIDAWGGLYDDMARLTSRARVLTVQLSATVPGLELVASHLETILPLFELDAAGVR